MHGAEILTDENKPSFLAWVRSSLLGHIVLLQFVWIVPLIVIGAGLTIFGRPQTIAHLLGLLIPAALGGLAVVYTGWYASAPRSSEKNET